VAVLDWSCVRGYSFGLQIQVYLEVTVAVLD
jgi:hypothetical protein